MRFTVYFNDGSTEIVPGAMPTFNPDDWLLGGIDEDSNCVIDEDISINPTDRRHAIRVVWERMP